MKITVTRAAWRRRAKWMLHYRPTGAAGSQVRMFYKRKVDAVAKQAELRASLDKHGSTVAAAMTPQQVHEYLEAKQIAAGTDLRDVARDWATRERKNIDSPHLQDAFTHWQASLRGTSVRYVETIKTVSKLVAKIGPTQLVADIEAEEITAAITDAMLAIETLANRRRMFGTFMAHCVRMGWRNDNPMGRVQRWRVVRHTPDFYSVTEVKEILKALKENEPRLLPAMALRLFAGIRTEELERIVQLGLEDDVRIAERQILIRGEVAKGRHGAPRPRLIEGLPVAIWPWLELGKLVWPTHAPRLVRKAVGKRVRRVHNGPRHTFATYAVTYFDSTEIVARKLGNSSSVALRHYMGVAPRAAAAEFFALDPAQLGA